MKNLATAAAAATLSVSASAAEFNLTFQHYIPPKSAMNKLLAEWAEKVKTDSNGRIDIKVYDSMRLAGKPPQLASQVETGFIDIAMFSPNYTPGKYPVSSVFALPFVGTNAEETSIAHQSLYEKLPEAAAEFSDVKVISIFYPQEVVVFSKGSPVNSLGDFKERKIRVSGRVVGQAFGALGATPVGMPLPEIPSSLANGVIDSVVVPYEVAPAIKLQELADYATEIVTSEGKTLTNTTLVLAINKKTYESLPEDLKAVIDNNSGMSVSKQFGSSLDVATGRIKGFIGKNVEINKLPLETADEMKARTAFVHQAWVDDMNSQGFDGQKILDAALAEFK